jgi:hypothetical protein
MLVAAFLNGALRELLIVPYVGEPLGHIISVLLLSGAIFGLAYLFVTAHRLLPARTLFRIGLFWLLLSRAGRQTALWTAPWTALRAARRAAQWAGRQATLWAGRRTVQRAAVL